MYVTSLCCRADALARLADGVPGPFAVEKRDAFGGPETAGLRAVFGSSTASAYGGVGIDDVNNGARRFATPIIGLHRADQCETLTFVESVGGYVDDLHGSTDQGAGATIALSGSAGHLLERVMPEESGLNMAAPATPGGRQECANIGTARSHSGGDGLRTIARPTSTDVADPRSVAVVMLALAVSAGRRRSRSGVLP